MNNLNLTYYDQIQITYSFDAGYDWGIDLIDIDDNNYSLDNSGNRGHNSFSKITTMWDLPKDREYNSLIFGSSSLSAKLHIYDITLIKYK